MNSVGRFQHDSSSKTCVFGSLWFEDLRPGQATVLVLRAPLWQVRCQGRSSRDFVSGPEFIRKFSGEFF